MTKRVFVLLVAGTMAGCAFSSWADQTEKAGPDKMIDASALFDDLTRRAKWCFVAYPERDPDIFVIDKRHLEKSLERLGDKIKKLKNKEFRERTKREPLHDFSFEFYSWDGKKMTRLGGFGFWKIVNAIMYLQHEGKAQRGGYLEFHPDESKAFLKEIKPILYNIDNALEGLDAPDNLTWDAMASVTQPCFADKIKVVLPKMERFLSDKDDKIRSFAAKRILRIAPDHPEAKRVLEKAK